jgi:hypothetical protein
MRCMNGLLFYGVSNSPIGIASKVFITLIYENSSFVIFFTTNIFFLYRLPYAFARSLRLVATGRDGMLPGKALGPYIIGAQQPFWLIETRIGVEYRIGVEWIGVE